MSEFYAEITPEERDSAIDRIAAAIVQRGMETPAVLFLEMNKPITYIASQGMIVMSPFFAPFIGANNMRIATRLMEKRENIELLMRRIEDLSNGVKPSKLKEEPDAAR